MDISVGHFLGILGFILALLGGGGFAGWFANGWKMRAELMPRTECDQRRSTCGITQANQMNDIWEALDEVRRDIKELLRESGGKKS